MGKSDISVDSLWLINKRDQSRKHSNMYHGNFTPKIPYRLVTPNIFSMSFMDIYLRFITHLQLFMTDVIGCVIFNM